MAQHNTLNHALVMGGSIAGLATACVLAEHFAQVTVVERDELPFEPENRRGVPQGTHAHGLLPIGQQIMEKLFPHFMDTMASFDAHDVENTRTTAMLGPFGWQARSTTGVRSLQATRKLIEHVIRTSVRARSNIAFRTATMARLVASNDRVTGIELQDGTRLDADLVVDAAGRASHAPKWLEDLGYPAPEDTTVNSFLGYASRLIRVPDHAWPGDEVRGIVQLPWPGITRGGVIVPQEGGMHILTLCGHTRDYPPADEKAFMEFLASISTPLVYETARQSEPLTEITATRSSVNRLRHFERMGRRPGGFVALGDAVCAFNPVYGQGMSTACLGAKLLGEVLAEVNNDLDTLPNHFQPKLFQAVQYPWSVSTGSDRRFPGTEVSGTVSMEKSPLMAGVAKLLEIATEDPEVVKTFYLANGFFKPELLMSDAMQAKLTDWTAKGRTPKPYRVDVIPPVMAAS